MPSLQNAYFQRDRAREYLKELESLCVEICEAELKASIIHVKAEVDAPKNVNDVYTIEEGNTSIPPRCGWLTGQVINCLRSALDYLIRNLSELESGIVPERTQFPIESLKDDFWRKAPTSLEGLTDFHIAQIERLQPFNGCKWTERLAAISSLHKHNDLVEVVHDLQYNGLFVPIPSTDPSIPRYKVHMEFTPTLYVCIGEEFPLIEALQEIESQVSQTLNAFEPEFK